MTSIDKGSLSNNILGLVLPSGCTGCGRCISIVSSVRPSIQKQQEAIERPFIPKSQVVVTYILFKHQPSFDDATTKMKRFANSLNKPFTCRWNDVKEKLLVDRNVKRGERKADDFGECWLAVMASSLLNASWGKKGCLFDFWNIHNDSISPFFPRCYPGCF